MSPRSGGPLVLASLAVVALACGASPAPPAPCPVAPPAPAAIASLPDASTRDDEASRRALFAELVALVRRYHVFAPQTERNLGHAWDAELPALEKEFAAASTRDALVVALVHFGNSLHNPHCGFAPAEQAASVKLDPRVDVEWTSGRPVFYVADPVSTLAAPGDVLDAIDGVSTRDLLERDALRSNENNWFSIARDVAAQLTHRSTRTAPVGSHVAWTLRPRDGGASKTIDLAWRGMDHEEGEGSDYAIPYDRRPCDDLRAAEYGPYAIAFEGPNFCLYTSSDARYRAYPIVRYFAFGYFGRGDSTYGPGFHRARADHDALAASLGALRGARAVLLDLRDNRGGNNPNWVLDWFAPAPYVDHYVYTRLDDDLRDPAFRHDANMDDGREAHEFLAQLDARAPGQQFAAKRPFFCRPDARGCDWDNRYVPSHRVTSLPIALMVGPDCVSACDSFAQVFADWSFGPLVGEPTAAGFTTRRLERTITYQGDTLGRLTLAFSYEVSGKTGAPVEAVPIPLTERVDRTFANRATYDALLVDRAIAAVGVNGKTTPAPAPAPVPAASALPSSSSAFDPQPRPWAIVRACWGSSDPEWTKGAFDVQLAIDASGRTTSAKVTGLDAGHAACVERLVARWTYPVKGGGTFDLPVRWADGRASAGVR